MSEGQEEVNVKKREREFALSSAFVLFGTSRNLMVPTHVGEGGSSLLSLWNPMPVASKNPPHSQIAFYQLSGHLLAQSN